MHPYSLPQSFYSWWVVFCVFFFQAEDGIRDGHVTGVQTCALPISQQVLTSNNLSRVTEAFGIPPLKEETSLNASLGATWRPRSEERRVGKECRSRRAAGH